MVCPGSAYNATGKTAHNAVQTTPFAPPSALRQVERESPLVLSCVFEKFHVCVPVFRKVRWANISGVSSIGLARKKYPAVTAGRRGRTPPHPTHQAASQPSRQPHPGCVPAVDGRMDTQPVGETETNGRADDTLRIRPATVQGYPRVAYPWHDCRLTRRVNTGQAE